jgi:hypothetical protein
MEGTSSDLLTEVRQSVCVIKNQYEILRENYPPCPSIPLEKFNSEDRT